MINPSANTISYDLAVIWPFHLSNIYIAWEKEIFYSKNLQLIPQNWNTTIQYKAFAVMIKILITKDWISCYRFLNMIGPNNKIYIYM